MNRKIILEGISYLEFSYLPYEYNPSEHILAEHDGKMDVLDVLDLIRVEGKLEKCFTDHSQELLSIDRGGIQPAFILLSQFGQELISEYVAMFRNNIPMMTVPFDENRNIHSKELLSIKRFLMSLTIKLYALSTSLEYNVCLCLQRSICPHCVHLKLFVL